MPDVTTIGSGFIWAPLAGAAARVLLFCLGVVVAGHYHCMANFMGRAPHVVRALLLPCISGAGMGVAVCAAVGAVPLALVFTALAAGCMTLINLAAWSAGAYVSEQFERAAEVKAQIRRDGWAFVRSFDGMAETARVLDSDRAPLEASRPQRERQP